MSQNDLHWFVVGLKGMNAVSIWRHPNKEKNHKKYYIFKIILTLFKKKKTFYKHLKAFFLSD